MVVVDSVALAITVSNDLVMPILLRRRGAQARAAEGEIGARVLIRAPRRDPRRAGARLSLRARSPATRRWPRSGCCRSRRSRRSRRPFSAALVWRRGTARGAAAGMIVGSLAWLYLLFLPSLDGRGRARAIFSPRARSASPGCARRRWSRSRPIRWSAASRFRSAPISSPSSLVSLSRQATPLERTQAIAFVGDSPGGKPQAFRLWRASATVGEIEATVARYPRRGARAARVRRAFRASAALELRAERRGRRASASATPSTCCRRRSAPRPRGWCCRCCCAGARCRANPR